MTAPLWLPLPYFEEIKVLEELMRMTYDPEVDILYIRLREGDIDESDEITPEIIADYGKDGKIMGLEILDASDLLEGKHMRVELAVAPGSD